VGGLGSADDGAVSGQREVNPRERNQVGLELVEIDVEGTVESEGGGDGGDDLGDESVKVGVSGRLDTEVLSADVVDGFVVDHERTVNVLESGVRGCEKTQSQSPTMRAEGDQGGDLLRTEL
jgi:hypothetical protein